MQTDLQKPGLGNEGGSPGAEASDILKAFIGAYSLGNLKSGKFQLVLSGI